MPPFFRSVTSDVRNAIQLVFPHAPAHITEILEFCVASLVYHEVWLRKVMPSYHPLFASPLWRKEVITPLRALVECRIYKDGDRIRATGVTATASLIGSVHRLTELIGAMPPHFERMRTAIVTDINALLEAKAVTAQAVTPDALVTIVERIMAPLNAKLEALTQRTVVPIPSQPPVPVYVL